MRKGKLPEAVSRRSVLKYINTAKGNVAAAAVSGDMKHKAYYGLNRVMNNLAARRLEPCGIAVSLLAGTQMEEGQLKSIIQEISYEADALNVQILGVNIETTDCVSSEILCFTAFGKEQETAKPEPLGTPAVMVTKTIGLEGASIIAELKERELSEYYISDLAAMAKAFKKELSIIPEAKALKNEKVLMYDLSQGGILDGLWHISEKTGMGMDIDMRAIPLRQETVEICEFFDLNPYELLSGGSMLIVAFDEEAAAQALASENIAVKVIGRLNSGNDRILRFGETKSFLNRPSADEIFKIV